MLVTKTVVVVLTVIAVLLFGPALGMLLLYSAGDFGHYLLGTLIVAIIWMVFGLFPSQRADRDQRELAKVRAMQRSRASAQASTVEHVES